MLNKPNYKLSSLFAKSPLPHQQPFRGCSIPSQVDVKRSSIHSFSCDTILVQSMGECVTQGKNPTLLGLVFCSGLSPGQTRPSVA